MLATLPMVVSNVLAAKGVDTVMSFVHVGKAGGDSIKSMLKIVCTTSTNCRSGIRSNDPQVHLRPVSDAEWTRWTSTERIDALVVSLRDPVSRVISAFNWRHPRGGFPVGYMGGIPYPDSTTANPWEVALYQCFEEVNDLANALYSSSWCGHVARQALGPNSVGHVGKGLEFYFSGLLYRIPVLLSLPIYAVRVKNMQDDFNCLCHTLHLPNVSNVPKANSAYPRQHATYLNSTGYSSLRRFLATEYLLYQILDTHSRC